MVYYDENGAAYADKKYADRPFYLEETLAVTNAGAEIILATGVPFKIRENARGSSVTYDYDAKCALYFIYYYEGKELTKEAKEFFLNSKRFSYEFEGKTLPAEFRYEFRGPARLC